MNFYKKSSNNLYKVFEYFISKIKRDAQINWFKKQKDNKRKRERQEKKDKKNIVSIT